jgi:hypothetical protein
MSTLRQYLSRAAKRKQKIEKENENKKNRWIFRSRPHKLIVSRAPRILVAALNLLMF